MSIRLHDVLLQRFCCMQQVHGALRREIVSDPRGQVRGTKIPGRWFRVCRIGYGCDRIQLWSEREVLDFGLLRYPDRADQAGAGQPGPSTKNMASVIFLAKLPVQTREALSLPPAISRYADRHDITAHTSVAWPPLGIKRGYTMHPAPPHAEPGALVRRAISSGPLPCADSLRLPSRLPTL